MIALPMRGGLFWVTIVALGTTVVVVAGLATAAWLVTASAGDVARAVLLLLAAAAAERLVVSLPNPRSSLGAYLLDADQDGGGCANRSAAKRARCGEDSVSVAGVLYVFALLALPAAHAIVLMAAARGLAGRWSRGAWRQRLFSLASDALALGAGGVLAHHAAWWPSAETAGAVAVAPAVIWYVLRTGTVVLLTALEDELPPGYAALQRRPYLLSELLLLAAGALLWVLWGAGLIIPGSLAVGVAVLAVYRSLQHTVLLQQQTVEALSALADLVDQRDAYTYQHSLRVGQYAERLALMLGCSREDARLIFLCGRLHDIGKCAVSNDVLLKPGPLSPSERAEMVRHAEIGAGMLAHFPEFKIGAALVRAHHERYDGRGYPDGLARSEIPLGARIIAVVDAYDAMTTDRPYRKALPHAEAVRRLQAGAGSQWDPRVVQKFLELLGEPPPPLWLRASLRLRGKTAKVASPSGA